jgi:TetR/AcrR family transcriptional repressor of nem operon
MVRCKEFDTEEALQMALEVLQTKGFDGASIRDLVEAMGISRQSLYDSYGEQATLYHTALDRYRSQAPARIGSFIESSLPLRPALARFFQNARHGFQVTARSGTSREELDAIIRVNLSIRG